MFCPKCGDELAVVRGTLTCVRGGMPLSNEMKADLIEVFIGKTGSTQRRLSSNTSGEWYCPGCGVPMIAKNGSVICPDCGGLLDDFVYPLIEFHPHRGAHGNWT